MVMDKFLTEQEAALRIGKTIRTLQLWRQRGEGPRWTYMGRTPLTTAEWILEYLKSMERQPIRRRTA
jgi:hypothetical protein